MALEGMPPSLFIAKRELGCLVSYYTAYKNCFIKMNIPRGDIIYTLTDKRNSFTKGSLLQASCFGMESVFSELKHFKLNKVIQI